MNIQKSLDNAVLTLTLSGRLDATTAPLLSEVVEKELAGVKKLILDFGFLEYVSSAGLRVILKAQKLMNAQGAMKLTNVNETIMEVFDITGFADILTIE